MTDYSTLPGINWSTLKHMRDSPMAYRHACYNQRADTPALRFGRAVHCLLLTTETWASEFAVFDGQRRGKAWEEFEQNATGKTILKPEEYWQASAVAFAVLGNKTARKYLDGARCEVPVQWTDFDTGLECKCRPDAIQERTLIEFKTTTSAETRRFGNEAARYGYHMQAAHYWNALTATGNRPEKIVFIVAEKNPPYDVSVFRMDDMALGLARDEVAALLRRVRECTDSGEWPGRYPDEQLLSLPTWTEVDMEFENA